MLVSHRVLRTQGYYPQGDNRKLNLLPRPSCWHLEGRGDTYWRNVEKSLHTLFIDYCFHLRALLWSFFLPSLLPSSHFPPFLSPSVIFLPFSFPSFFLPFNIYWAPTKYQALSQGMLWREGDAKIDRLWPLFGKNLHNQIIERKQSCAQM